MKLELLRTYYPNGTNGEIQYNGKRMCNTIELPWKNNLHQISCIPEGEYKLTKRYSPAKGWHLLVNNVANRDLILIHAANDALKELKGCIAPVSLLTGEGKGSSSRLALDKLNKTVFAALDKKETIFLTIKSDQ